MVFHRGHGLGEFGVVAFGNEVGEEVVEFVGEVEVGVVVGEVEVAGEGGGAVGEVGEEGSGAGCGEVWGGLCGLCGLCEGAVS